MHSQRKATQLVVMLGINLLLLGFSTGSHAELPRGLAGTWQVIEVHVNTEATATMHYGWNDPALRWRVFTFSDAQVSADAPEPATCDAPRRRRASPG